MSITENKLFNRLGFIKHNDLFGKSISNLGLQIVGISLSYIAVYLISHVYNADVLGYYTLSNVVMQIASMIVLFGINTATVQIIPGLFAKKDTNSISSLIIKGIFHTIIVGLITSAILYFSANIIAAKILHKPQLAAAYQIVSFAVIPLSLLTLLADFLRGCGKNILWAVITRLVTPFLFIVTFGAVYIYNKNPEPVLLNTIAYLLTLFVAIPIFLLFIQKNKISLSLNHLNSSPSYSELKKISFPMFLFSSNILIGGWLTTLMVGIYGTTSDTGIYRVIDRVSSICTLVLLAINAVLAPKIAGSFANKDFALLKQNVIFATKLNFWLSLPIQIILIVFHKQVLGIFGHEFIRGGSALIIILISYMFNSLTGPVGQVLNMTNYQVYLRNVSFIGLLLTALLCYLLIPAYGISGAAVASMSNTIFINITCAFKIKKEFSFNCIYIPLKRFQTK